MSCVDAISLNITFCRCFVIYYLRLLTKTDLQCRYVYHIICHQIKLFVVYHIHHFSCLGLVHFIAILFYRISISSNILDSDKLYSIQEYFESFQITLTMKSVSLLIDCLLVFVSKYLNIKMFQKDHLPGAVNCIPSHRDHIWTHKLSVKVQYNVCILDTFIREN